MLASSGSFGGEPSRDETAAASPQQPGIDADRPDRTNSTSTVPKCLAQLETGARYGRVPVTGESLGTPVSLRVGVANWLEARLDTDGVTRAGGESPAGLQFAGLAVGGKLELWQAHGGTPAVAVQPAVTLPVGRGADGGTDYSLTLIASADLSRRTHLDVNYGLGDLAAGRSHFVQHLLSASASFAIGAKWSPYVEVYWFSRTDPGGPRVLSMDAGATYSLSERLAVDGGVLWGLAAADAHPAMLAGLSVILGEIAGHKGVHARLLEAQQRARQ
jgi:hypothetical protein